MLLETSAVSTLKLIKVNYSMLKNVKVGYLLVWCEKSALGELLVEVGSIVVVIHQLFKTTSL